MFEQQSGPPDQVKLEREILAFWQERDIFGKLRARNRGGPRFSFLDGPITANNRMGIHHARGRALKDIFQRYWAMRGRDQRYQNGFDCQGLWVEVEVERDLGFTSKRDIERYGVAEFVGKCKERVNHFSQIIRDESIRLGCWMDWPNSYYTLSDENNYAIWDFLKRCHARGLVYPGTDVMPWCPRCGTGLSQQEMQEGYREVVHPGVVLRLRLVGREREYLLVWTTTPWTLTANVACAVHPDVPYARVRQGGAIYHVACERASEVVTGEAGWEIEAEVWGRELAGLRYEGPFDDLPLARGAVGAHRLVPWGEVAATEGTGIVHIAPGCGKEDYDLAREHSLPVVVPIEEDGRFVPEAGPFRGRPASEAGEAVIESLRGRGLLYRVDDYRHRYPHCWRCGSEVLFRLVDEWFIAMDPWREEIKAIVREVRWVPEYGREIELDWLTNMRDWMISKKRYWGLALPIWQCACGWFDVIGGPEELRERAAEGWDGFEGHSPHRPWVDAVKIACGRCGRLASRIPDVGNPWLDAGIVPYSTMGYFEDRAQWERWFPADLVIECLPGQFRNWFYALLAMSAMVEGRKPVKTIAGYGLVVDENGEEMHKSKGNAIWFSDAADQVGADPIRWVSAAEPLTEPLRFGPSGAGEVRGWLGRLWNCYSFLATYANVDGWPAPGAPAPSDDIAYRAALDRWLRARLASAAQEVSGALESFHPSRATGPLLSLLDDVSNWWVRRSRRRFWKGESDEDKGFAYCALWSALVTFARLLAPIMPFTAEALYQRLAAPFAKALPESVHLCEFPELSAPHAEAALVEECRRARLAVRLGRAARAEAGLRVRQPLAAAFVVSEGGPESLFPHFERDVVEELNVRKLEFVDRASLGAHFAEEGGVAVGVEARLTEELRLEGIARDLVRHIQMLRKRAGLRVDQRIRLSVECGGEGEAARALVAFGDYIAGETLAERIDAGPPRPEAVTSDIHLGGSPVTIGLAPA